MSFENCASIQFLVFLLRQICSGCKLDENLNWFAVNESLMAKCLIHRETTTAKTKTSELMDLVWLDNKIITISNLAFAVCFPSPPWLNRNKLLLDSRCKLLQGTLTNIDHNVRYLSQITLFSLCDHWMWVQCTRRWITENNYSISHSGSDDDEKLKIFLDPAHIITWA